MVSWLILFFNIKTQICINHHPEFLQCHPEFISGSLICEIPKQVRNDDKNKFSMMIG